ncbi:MAG: ubiquinol oxidase subunit II [Pseudomonadota bacterium]|nr:ubiquinol oxidase subunit II [Pseudomonadota bacterium]
MSAPSRTRLLCLAAALALTGCQAALLDPRGPVGAAEKTILIDSLAIMLAIVVPTIVATLGFAWWYRAGNAKARHLPDWAFSGRIELVVWAIPVMVIILLGGVTWIGAHQLDPGRPLQSKTPALDVQVVSLDWKWLFIYPGQRIATINQLVVPAGVPLHFSLTSASVMNVFFVPQLGSMIYTMNGMATELHLQADQPGTFYGQSAHFSGDGFSDMHFEVRALPAEAFAAWVATTQGAGGALGADSYTALARQSSNLPPSSFASVEPELFHRIVVQQIAPGPGPATERAGIAETSPAAGRPHE